MAKTISLNEIFSLIESTAPPVGAAAWDKSGLQVACQRDKVGNLAVCLDPVESSVRQAIGQGADCILAHHPLSLAPTLPNRDDNWYRVLKLLLCHDIPLYSAHTSLDTNPDGPAGWLARELELSNMHLLEPLGANNPDSGRPAGFGIVGTLPQPLDMASLCKRLAMHIGPITASAVWPQGMEEARDGAQGGHCTRFTRLAYCTGSGSSLLPAAARAGADIFITGDVKYHTALETPVCLLDVGHHSLEEEMMRRFACHLQKMAGIRVFFVPSVSPFKIVHLEK